MADSASLVGSGINGMDYKQEVYSKCFKCTDLENQLQEVCSELSSSQLIIKLLYKELKEATQKDEVRSTSVTKNRNQKDINFPTQWSAVGTKRHNNNKTSVDWNYYKMPNQYWLQINMKHYPI
jgi:hypothetical protein